MYIYFFEEMYVYVLLSQVFHFIFMVIYFIFFDKIYENVKHCTLFFELNTSILINIALWYWFGTWKYAPP